MNIIQRGRLPSLKTRHLVQWRQAATCRSMSTAPGPYKVYTGASFAGKPLEDRPVRRRRRTVIDFPEGSDISSWRKEMLSRPKAVQCSEAGEDFFYIQDVRLFCCLLNKYHLNALYFESHRCVITLCVYNKNTVYDTYE